MILDFDTLATTKRSTEIEEAIIYWQNKKGLAKTPSQAHQCNHFLTRLYDLRDMGSYL